MIFVFLFTQHSPFQFCLSNPEHKNVFCHLNSVKNVMAELHSRLMSPPFFMNTEILPVILLVCIHSV